MDLGLKDKTVFITGASSGIGASAAQIFSAEGADVIVSYGKNTVGAGQTAAKVRANGRSAWLCPMDVSDPDSVKMAVHCPPAEIHGLDALVLCAGLSLHAAFAEITPAEWQRVLDCQPERGVLRSAGLHAPAPGRRLRRAGLQRLGPTGVSHQAHYAAAKAGLVNLAKSAARALAPRIRVNCVTPGLTLTPMGLDTIAALEPDYARNKMLLQRYATPEEIAQVIVFLASPLNSFMTGATVDVNGGRDLR